EDGRIVVVKTGTFTLRTADTFDTGLYHCIGTNYNDADTLTFRITVVDPYVEHNSVNGAKLSTFAGSTLYLPCTSTAVPDAAISWVLPEHVILHNSVRNRHIFDNGTLRIQGVTERDGGYFRCVAANQYGVDLLVFQVLVRKDETTLKKKHAAAGEWEEDDGSGNALLTSATRQKHPLATPATLTANQESAASASRNGVAQSAHKRNSYGKMTYRHYRDKISRRFRGHRRPFVSSARRVDPQRWAAFLEKTKRNSTLIEIRGEVATKPPIQARKFSKVPGDEDETSGDLVSPEEEFMIPVTETATVSALGRAVESAVTAGPEMTVSNTPARKTSLLGAEAVTPLPSPFPQSVPSESRRSQTYLKPTITNSWGSSDLTQISANGIKQLTVSNGASRTATLFPAGQRLVYSGGSNNQHLEPVSTTPTTDVTDTSMSVTSQNTVDKLHVFTESIDKISTKTDHQISVVTVSDPSPEFGHNYFHSTQKRVTPKPPLDTTTITHQQIQVIQDVTTQTPQAQQQYGRRRKISGRRRIVRPGHILSMKEHRHNFGRLGSVRGSTAVAADVQLNMKYVSNLPTLNNLSSSINPFSPEAPLSSPSTMNMPLEHPEDTHQNTAFLGEEKNQASARQEATAMVMPLIAKGTQDTPQWEFETSALFQTNTDRVQPFSIRQPTTATHSAPITTETTHTEGTKISSTLESFSPGIKPRTSAKNSQRGKITWEHLFGSGAQKDVLPLKLPEQQTGMFLSTEVSTMLPKTTAALSASKMPLLHSTPISTGGNHSSGVLSLNKPSHYGNGKSEHLPTAKPQSDSGPATSATKETDVTSLKPTVAPIVAPQTDIKITKNKIFRVGRKRGQRRRRPPKTSTSQHVTAGQSTAGVPSGNTAVPVVTALTSLSLPTSLTPAEPLSESAGAVSVTEMPALCSLHTPAAPQHVPTAATQPPAAPLTGRNTQPATLPAGGRVAHSRATTSQAAALLSKPSSAASIRPATVSAATGSEPAQQIKATATAGEKSHLKMQERVIQENPLTPPTFPARTESSGRAPAAFTDIAAPKARHPTPPP
ncbi:IGS10 protein, partial [Ibidorhyncha struthersii]|nr:IGS10 protein [Ibidorhyncha struthersii]